MDLVKEYNSDGGKELVEVEPIPNVDEVRYFREKIKDKIKVYIGEPLKEAS